MLYSTLQLSSLSVLGDAVWTISFKCSKWDRCDGSGSCLEIGRTGYSCVVVEEVTHYDGDV